MTDQLTPTELPDATATSTSTLPPPTLTRAERIKSEIMAGGAVSERGDDEVAGGWQGLAGDGGDRRPVRLAGVRQHLDLRLRGRLVISIFLHELGHFVTARWTGMKVTQFFLGFGPRLWSFRRGETEYGVRALPLGAFVRIIGMNNLDEVEPADEARTYRQQSFPKRLLVISAGSIMHIADRHRPAVRRLRDAGRDRRPTIEPRVVVGAAQAELPAAAGGHPAPATRSSPSTALPSTSPDELGNVVRTFEPSDIGRRRRADRDGVEQTIVVGARGQHDRARGRSVVRLGLPRRAHVQPRRTISSDGGRLGGGQRASPTSSPSPGSRRRASSRCSTR